MVDSPIGKIRKSWTLFVFPFSKLTIQSIRSSLERSLCDIKFSRRNTSKCNFPVPLTIFFTLSLLTLTFHIDSLSDCFSSKFNFFATSWTKECMTLEIFMKAWLPINWVCHFFHGEGRASDTWTLQPFIFWSLAISLQYCL